MKKITIIGANSYLGDNVANKLDNSGYLVHVVDVTDSNFDLSNLDLKSSSVVINVAAIVHRPKEDDQLFYKVNRDLAISIAKKAKEDGVELFVQISTKGVFGKNVGIVDENSDYNPITAYEKSKYEADVMLKELRSDDFKVCIVRPPMIYGKGCKGNFPRLEKLALRFPIFPDYKNSKEMVYIGNVVSFIVYAIKNELNGDYYPRNPEPICVSDMVKSIAILNNHKIHFTKLFNPIIRLLIGKNHIVTSIFATSLCSIDDKSGFVPPYSLEASLEEMYRR